MSQRNDEELIRDTQKGDLTAFKELVKQHEGAVAGVVKSMLRATEEAADVGQEVFIRFYQSLGKFKGESSLRTYLVRIAINLSLNELKKRKHRRSFFASASEGDQVAATEHKMDLKEWLEYEFNLLEPEFKSVATLRLVEGYSTEETAQLLQIPLGTVLSRLARAQKKLKSRLQFHLKN
ncbi:MAG: RNA polymerase sigma factor [Cyclobacteriaceae bacterium]|jgi:RNA polymerase sigma-70 factor (ECF subfamily)|nr:sigma-70 family RNA polymerase sigma factor [Flammeovirgaceae bacterium]